MRYLKILIIGRLMMIDLGCSKAVDVNVEKENLLNADRAFAAKSVEVGAAEAFNLYFRDDAVLFPSGANPIYGREDIYNGMKGEYQLTWEPQDCDVAKSGEFGYTWGKYKYTYKNENGETITSYGKYVNVWKKVENGDWKVLVDIGNSSPKPE